METNSILDQPKSQEEEHIWQSPRVSYLGQLSELVQGGTGKTMGPFDSDPNGPQLPPGKA